MWRNNHIPCFAGQLDGVKMNINIYYEFIEKPIRKRCAKRGKIMIFENQDFFIQD